MGEASRTAVMSTMYKNKGERSDWAMYRPVSVTTILYRIYGGCLEQCLARAMPFIIGDSQVGYARKRKLDENVNLVTEVIRYLDNDAPSEGGLLLNPNLDSFDGIIFPCWLSRSGACARCT